ncbi:MAG: hypothetical protein KDK30_12240 [Leptospiraceae bacterium]|nr:hypothetical protein [Leptospiraceae bacterium]
MPTYNYRCDDCGHEYEAFQSMKDDPHTECPECGGQVKRLIGAGAGIVFKGSGFYVTDYRKDSGKSGGSQSSGGSTSSGSDAGSSGSNSSGGGSGSAPSGGSGSGGSSTGSGSGGSSSGSKD